MNESREIAGMPALRRPNPCPKTCAETTNEHNFVLVAVNSRWWGTSGSSRKLWVVQQPTRIEVRVPSFSLPRFHPLRPSMARASLS